MKCDIVLSVERGIYNDMKQNIKDMTTMELAASFLEKVTKIENRIVGSERMMTAIYQGKRQPMLTIRADLESRFQKREATH